MAMESVKYPCQGCIYFKACGVTSRTYPCNGRRTKTTKDTYNVYDIHMKPDKSGWVVDGEYGRQTYTIAMTMQEAIKAYMNKK